MRKEENSGTELTDEGAKKRSRWKKTAAILAFLFFLIKGLLWLAGIYFGAQLFGC